MRGISKSVLGWTEASSTSPLAVALTLNLSVSVCIYKVGTIMPFLSHGAS